MLTGATKKEEQNQIYKRIEQDAKGSSRELRVSRWDSSSNVSDSAALLCDGARHWCDHLGMAHE